jgi:hypothetical protein
MIKCGQKLTLLREGRSSWRAPGRRYTSALAASRAAVTGGREAPARPYSRSTCSASSGSSPLDRSGRSRMKPRRRQPLLMLAPIGYAPRDWLAGDGQGGVGASHATRPHELQCRVIGSGLPYNLFFLILIFLSFFERKSNTTNILESTTFDFIFLFSVTKLTIYYHINLVNILAFPLTTLRASSKSF